MICEVFLQSHAVTCLRGVDRQLLLLHIEFGARAGRNSPSSQGGALGLRNSIGFADQEKSAFFENSARNSVQKVEYYIV